MKRRKRNPTARQLYADFHEAAPRELIEIELDLPDEAMVLGEVESVVYKPPRHSKRAPHVYEHEFGDIGLPIKLPARPLLAYSPDLPGVLFIVGDYDVDDRGIIG